jgi:dihydrofolate reductase
MTRTQYYTAVSVDGFIADEHNSLDWLTRLPRSPESEARFAAFFAEVGAMAMGATTYEWVLTHERVHEEPDRWRGYYGDTPCWVFTHRRLPPIPGVDIAFVAGDVAAAHQEMVAAARGRNVWLVGGGELVGQFCDRGLLDEVLFSVAPVTLGAGAPVLPRRLTTALTLTDVARDGEFALLSYAVRRDADPRG